MMTKRITAVLCVLWFAGALMACTGPEKHFEADAQKDGMTLYQAWQSWYGESLQYWFMLPKKGGGYDIKYSLVTTHEILTMIKEAEEDWNSTIDDPRFERVVRVLGLDNTILEQRRIYKILLDNLRYHRTYAQFKELLGESGFSDEKISEAFSITMVLPPKQEYAFTSEKIERAKEAGRLRLIQELTLHFHDTLAKKDSDPNDPDEKNKFVWKEKTQAMLVRTYKITSEDNQPQDNAGDYVEIYRIIADNTSLAAQMKPESRPCIRIFASAYSRTMNLYVIDLDKESAEHGFGMPDIVEKMQSITKGSDLYLNVPDVIEMAWQNRAKPLFKHKVKTDEMSTEFKPVGAPPPISWIKAPGPEGFRVPFRYMTAKKDNYKVGIDFVKPVLKNIFKSYHSPTSEYQDGPGKVMEYFKIKTPYNDNVLDVSIGMNKEISITPMGGAKTSAPVAGENIFTGDKPYQIDYTDDDGKRWRIADLDDDGIFESKRRVRPGEMEDMEAQSRELERQQWEYEYPI